MISREPNGMFRVRKSILDSLKLQRKRFVRHLSTPTLPEFADVVIIGKTDVVGRDRERI